jgi:hypothetical protein
MKTTQRGKKRQNDKKKRKKGAKKAPSGIQNHLKKFPLGPTNHAKMQKLVVQMKDELEKIKEQVLNVL